MHEIGSDPLAGTFTLPSGQALPGNLTLGESSPLLKVYARDFIKVPFQTTCDVQGTLYDRTNVSLLECTTSALTSYGKSDGGGSHYSVDVYPQFVLTGDVHITSEEALVRAVHFEISDATALFFDTEAFGMVLDARPHIEKIASIDSPTGSLDDALYPEIYYYTGKRSIFSANTVLGKVSASHCPSMQLPGPHGFRMDNSIQLSIEFEEPRTIQHTIQSIVSIRRFAEILIGRPQSFAKMNLRLTSDDEHPLFLTVHMPNPPARYASRSSLGPQPTDVLIRAASDAEQIQRVIAGWLDRQDSWNDARFRFATSFEQQNFYDVDRLVGAANMFDILPADAISPVSPLRHEIADVRDSSREAFLQLPPSPERDSALSALGRLGKHNLKQKMRRRATVILDAVGEHFPELEQVVDEAVNCRNHYVHGSQSQISYDENFACVMFFVDALEFVFAASDLIDAGWDINEWLGRSGSLSHPFTRFRFGYQENLDVLKSLLGAGPPTR